MSFPKTYPLGARALIPAPRTTALVSIHNIKYGDFGIQSAALSPHRPSDFDHLSNEDFSLLFLVLKDLAEVIASMAMELADSKYCDEILKLHITLHQDHIEVNPIGADFVRYIRTSTTYSPLCGHCGGHPATHFDDANLPTCHLCPVDDAMLR